LASTRIWPCRSRFLTAVTVVVISACYMRIIEVFPHGGGGYLVATKLLGESWGIVAGSALLVDYVLTITVSVAAAGEAFFSLVPGDHLGWKLPFETFIIVLLLFVNLRGVRESILVLTPIFLTFIVTHAALIIGGIIAHAAIWGRRPRGSTSSSARISRCPPWASSGCRGSSAGVLAGRRNVHRDRGRLEWPRRHARAQVQTGSGRWSTWPSRFRSPRRD
jgi:amino acid transporter